MASPAQPINVEIIRINPRDIKLLDHNARFMPHEQFRRLVANVKRDGGLTSAPFLAMDAEGRWEALSGNHRVLAAIEAEVEEIIALATRDPIPQDRRVAIQLSHNAIVGQDDPATLAALYASIHDVEMRLYSGLDDIAIGALEEADTAALSEFGLEHRPITLLFLPHEKEKVEQTFRIAQESAPAGDLALVDLRDFNRFCATVERVQADFNVSNRATALKVILDVFERHYAPPEPAP